MKIHCIGGGPGGLYFATLMKLRNPDHEVTLIESNRAGETMGWGLVLTEGLLGRLESCDPVTAGRIRESIIAWDKVSVEVDGRRITSGGHEFLGISRLNLITILQQRAEELGVAVQYERRVAPEELSESDADLVVISDGATSRLRTHFADRFDATLDLRPNKYIWLGTRKTFENAFKFIFERTDAGWIWGHCYQFDADTSTFVVECTQETWRGLGFDRMTPEEAAKRCESIFAAHLDGHALMINDSRRRKSLWTNFGVVRCGRWHHGNMVLLGNAAHSAHFSIGSGTRLALEDAMALVDALDGLKRPDPARLEAYQQKRQTESAGLHRAAWSSMLWFENIAPYLEQDPLQFTYALLTRSGRIGHESLRGRDGQWLQQMERWFSDREGAKAMPANGAGTVMLRPSRMPLALRGVTLKNRIVGEYPIPESVEDPGLVMVEIGIDHERPITGTQVAGVGEAGLIELVSKAARHGRGHVGVRLVGRLPRGHGRIPDEATVIRNYAALADLMEWAGFGLLELDLGGDPALVPALTPAVASAVVSATDDDMPAERDETEEMTARLGRAIGILRTVRAAWPKDKPISVRLGGLTEPDGTPLSSRRLAAAVRLLRNEDVDILDVPLDWRMHVLGAPRSAGCDSRPVTLAVGRIDKPDQIDALILAGRAELCRPAAAAKRPLLHAFSNEKEKEKERLKA